MGGSIERIQVVPIGMADETAAKLMLANVDVSKSQCYLESDRQRLLGNYKNLKIKSLTKRDAKQNSHASEKQNWYQLSNL